MLIQSRSTKCVYFPICFAGQSGFAHVATSTSIATPFVRIGLIFPWQHGHSLGSASLSESAPAADTFSAIWGMILLALYTKIVSPMRSCSFLIMETLCTLARETVVPSSSTGSNTATGFRSPVLLGDHSIARNVVSTVSSCHFRAKPSSLFGLWPVPGCNSAYSTSFAATTRPSTGNAYSDTLFVILCISSIRSDTEHKMYSVVSNPSDFRNSMSLKNVRGFSGR